jgi:hemolysin activation/secretion protein
MLTCFFFRVFLLCGFSLLWFLHSEHTLIYGKNFTRSELNHITKERNFILHYQKKADSLRRDIDQHFMPSISKKTIKIPDFPLPSSSESDLPHFEIKKIIITGNIHFPKKLLRQLKKKYEGHFLTLKDMLLIAKILTAHTVENGYITSYVSLPEQSLSEGILTFHAIEGTIETIIMDGKETFTFARLTAFPFLRKKALNIRDIEQGLDQLRTLKSMDPNIRIEPSRNSSKATLYIDTGSLKKTVGGSLSVTNQTFKKGNLRPSIFFYSENILGINDSWNFSVYDEGDYKKHTQNSRYMSLQLPFGYWTFLSKASSSSYLNRIESPFRIIDNRGLSRSLSAQLKRTLLRSKTSVSEAFIDISCTDFNSYIEDMYNPGSSYRQTIVRMGITHQWTPPIGHLQWHGSYHRGIDLFTATKDLSKLPRRWPHFQFQKATVQFNYLTSFTLLKKTFLYSFSLFQQLSPVGLHYSEKVILDDLLSGYNTDISLSGETGFFLRHTLRMPITSSATHSLFLEPSLSGGYIWSKEAFSRVSQAGLIGTGVRLSFQTHHKNVSLHTHFPLKASRIITHGSSHVIVSSHLNF